jgi:arginase family enzyme
MALAGACGRWEPGLVPDRADQAKVVLAGVRDLDPPEREALEAGPVTVIGASPVETLVAVSNALDREPVYVHLDLDVIDPEEMAAQFPAPDGLTAEKLFDVLEAVAETSELVGLEVTCFEAPDDSEERQELAETVMHVLEPLLAVVPEEAGVGG